MQNDRFPQGRTMPVPLDCRGCKARGIGDENSEDPIPEPVNQVGQLAGGLCGWCGGSGKLSTRVDKLYDEALAKLKAELAPKMLVEPEKT